MKYFLLVCLFFQGLCADQSTTMYVWKEVPRITLGERITCLCMESISASIAAYYMHAPRWAYALMPSAGACMLAPSLLRGYLFKKRAQALQKKRIYDPHDPTDPLLYITAVQHPSDPAVLFFSVDSLYRAYEMLGTKEKYTFAKSLLFLFEYDSCQQALQAVSTAKQYRRRQLKEIALYTDIEQRLTESIANSRLLQADERLLQLLFFTPIADLAIIVQQLLESGKSRTPLLVDTRTYTVQDLDSSEYYKDDFVYYYATMYGFELIKVYGLLLVLEKIWTDLCQVDAE